MKKTILSLTAYLFAVTMLISCQSTPTKQNKNEKQASDSTAKDSSKTIIAKYIEGGSFEGDENLIFETEDGKRIEFYRNYFDPQEPKLTYNFLSEEGVSGNKEFIGKEFIIRYKKHPKGKISAVSGEAEPCNQILSAEKK